MSASAYINSDFADFGLPGLRRGDRIIIGDFSLTLDSLTIEYERDGRARCIIEGRNLRREIDTSRADNAQPLALREERDT